LEHVCSGIDLHQRLKLHTPLVHWFASERPQKQRTAKGAITPLNGVWEEQVVVEVESAGWIGSQSARHITSGVLLWTEGLRRIGRRRK